MRASTPETASPPIAVADATAVAPGPATAVASTEAFAAGPRRATAAVMHAAALESISCTTAAAANALSSRLSTTLTTTAAAARTAVFVTEHLAATVMASTADVQTDPSTAGIGLTATFETGPSDFTAARPRSSSCSLHPPLSAVIPALAPGQRAATTTMSSDSDDYDRADRRGRRRPFRHQQLEDEASVGPSHHGEMGCSPR